jgi:hypothetical protein
MQCVARNPLTDLYQCLSGPPAERHAQGSLHPYKHAAFTVIWMHNESVGVLKECFSEEDLSIPGHYMYDSMKKSPPKMQILQGLAFLCMEIG